MPCAKHCVKPYVKESLGVPEMGFRGSRALSLYAGLIYEPVCISLR